MTRRADCAETLRAEQRRMGLLALLACLWLLGASLLGASEALGYLAPTLALLGLLVIGRYPGEQLIRRRLSAVARVRRARRTRSRAQRRAYRLLPRGGALLAARLAGRAPPAFAA